MTDFVRSGSESTPQWLTTSLGEVTSWASGGTPSKKNPKYWDGEIPWISAKSLKDFYLRDSDDRISEEAVSAGARIAEPGDVLLLVRGMTLHNDVPIGIAMRPMAFNQDVKCIRGRNGVDSRFIAYWLLANKPRLLDAVDQASHGTGRLQTDVLQQMGILVPPADEQKAIVSILGSLDDKIEHNRRTAQALERLARAIFKAWFVDFEPVKAKAEGATSFPSMPQDVFDALPTTFVDTEIGPVPEGWGVGKLGDYCLVNRSSVRKGEIDGTIEYVDISSVTEGRLDEIREVDFDEAPSRARRRVANGDTIWSCVRPNRKSYLFIHTPPENRIVSTGFAVLSPGGFGPSYLYELTTRQEFVDYLVANAQGSAYPAVRADTFSDASVVVPPREMTNAFEARTMPARDLVAVQDDESRRLAAFRDYLLPKLLTGAVDAVDESALIQV